MTAIIISPSYGCVGIRKQKKDNKLYLLGAASIDWPIFPPIYGYMWTFV